MKFKIGFTAEKETEKKAPETETKAPEGAPARESLARVYFPQRGFDCTYYNNLFDLHVGDLVYVDGKLEGKRGKVIDVSYTFKIKLSDYKREQFVADIAKRMIEKGGRRDIFLGARECQGYVEPCEFGSGKGAYDEMPELAFGLMYHGITYADEAYSDETKNRMTVRFWYPTMKKGVITFPRPEECTITKTVRENMAIKPFGEDLGNFIGLREFGEVE